MDGIQAFFANLTPAQAEALSADSNVLSAAIVAVFAPLVFHLVMSRGVHNFHDAVKDLQKAAERANSQAQTASYAVQTVSKSLSELGVLLSSLQESLANTQNTLLEAQPDTAQSPQADAQTDNRQEVKSLWRILQEIIERSAADSRINGNTRAKYARADRRAYLPLIQLIHSDGNLRGDMELWRQAYQLSRNAFFGNGNVPAATVQRMQELVYALSEATEFGIDTAPQPNGGKPRFTRPTMDHFPNGSVNQPPPLSDGPSPAPN